ncbi:MAG: polyprenyl synthetase family protein [Pseudomonadota bacterium]
MIIEADFLTYQQRINRFLADYLPTDSNLLHQAMCYSVLEGGKRLRPLLVYSLGEALGLPLERLDHAACSVELIHAYSLIHDDLPMMDNDDCRRGKPSCHKKFGEAIALLAGDALQALAFEVLLQAPLEPTQILRMLKALTKAAGSSGMAGGQALEFSGLATPLSSAALEVIYRLKTGSLFRASLELVGITANSPSGVLLSLGRLGDAIGLVYQLQDDTCDNEIPFQDLMEGKSDFQHRLIASFDDLEALLPTFSSAYFMRLFSTLLFPNKENSFL